MSDWSQLPIELLELIGEQLVFLSDLLNFSYVCTAWGSAISRKRHRFCHRHPLLMLPGESHTMTRRFFSLPEKRVYTTHLPQIYQKCCYGCSKGWLVLVDVPTSEVKLFNPFSRVEVQLPPLTKFPYPAYFDQYRHERPRGVEFILKAIISSDPTQSSDCIVMAIVSYNQLLCFCRPGDESWTTMETTFENYEDVIHYKGLFYAIEIQGHVVACDVSTMPIATLAIPNYIEKASFLRKYFVESTTGDLLLIMRRLEFIEPDDLEVPERNKYRKYYHTVKFEVLKLDLVQKEWTELHSIGDQILLLGHGDCISLSAHDHPEWRVNSIYFTDDEAKCDDLLIIECHDMGVFSFEDGNIKPLLMNNGPWFESLIWVTQNP